MAKKTFATKLQHQVDKQDESLKTRFAAADSLLLSEEATDLKSRAKAPAKAKKKVEVSPADLVVRDTFSMPPEDYRLIEQMRSRAAKEGYIYSKSEIVRAGLQALSGLPAKGLLEQLGRVEKIKPGRKV